jgi:hypothetical protein
MLRIQSPVCESLPRNIYSCSTGTVDVILYCTFKRSIESVVANLRNVKFGFAALLVRYHSEVHGSTKLLRQTENGSTSTTDPMLIRVEYGPEYVRRLYFLRLPPLTAHVAHYELA